jgi:hypothetical protein
VALVALFALVPICAVAGTWRVEQDSSGDKPLDSLPTSSLITVVSPLGGGPRQPDVVRQIPHGDQ